MAIARALAGRTALITGSTSGIGLAIAQRLAAAGASVMLNGLDGHADKPAGTALISSMERLGVKAALSAHDLSTAAGVEGMFLAARAAFGRVDIIVNNAGIQHVAPIESFPVDKFNLIMAVNLAACWHLTRLSLPDMKESGYGRIINIASVHGHVASVNKSAYVAAKHGLVGLTKAVALETAGTGVTCNAICPGWVLTPLVEAQIRARAASSGKSTEAAAEDLLAEKQPSKQFVEPSALGDLAVFLCSPSAAQMTGISLPMDGGWTAQ